MQNHIGVIVVAAGESRRFIGEGVGAPSTLQKKPFINLAGRAVWIHSVEKFRRRDGVGQIIVCVSPEDMSFVAETFAQEIETFGVELVAGGAERYLSVANALERLAPDAEYVAIHDAARPCVTTAELDAVFVKAAATGAAILAVPAYSSFKRSRKSGNDDVVAEPVSRVGLWEALTPQVFKRELIERAYRERPQGTTPTDDAELVAALGVDVALVEGRRTNIKITRPDDLALAQFFIERQEMESAFSKM
jgi:2-C-methyl-D-erythritol 4-phosphate cytidylyltransferase